MGVSAWDHAAYVSGAVLYFTSNVLLVAQRHRAITTLEPSRESAGKIGPLASFMPSVNRAESSIGINDPQPVGLRV